MSILAFPKRQMFLAVFFLFLGIIAFCFFNAGIAFATEQYVTAADRVARRTFAADVARVLIFLAALPMPLFIFSLSTQWNLSISSEWKIKGEMAKVIRPTKDTRKRVLVMALIAFGVTLTSPISISILTLSNYPNPYVLLLLLIATIALFSAAAVTQGAYVLVFPDGKIWYKTHMKLRYRSFNVSDIEFVEEYTIGKFNFSTIYLKEGTHTRLFWLFFPPKFREYLVEQEVHIVTKGEKKDSHG